MIEKIQNLIEDNTSIDVTKKQVILFLIVVCSSLVLIVLVMVKFSSGVKKDPSGYVPPQSNIVDPVHI